MALLVEKNINLAPFSNFKIGGPAEFFVEVKNKEELEEAVKWAEENKEKVFILGGGSNILINDKGVSGLVIKMANDGISVKGERMDCGAGASLAKAASLAVNNNLTGMEWSIGIPRATLGGAARGNAEAFGAAMSDIIETVEIFDVKKIKFKTLSNKDCKFSYRSSIFKKNNDYIIWSAVFKLKNERPEIIRGLAAKSAVFRGRNYPKLPSAGSVFKNVPVKLIKENNPKLLEEIRKRGITRLDNVGAGMLIDMLGLKGKTIGGAKISLEHANHIVNTGKATAEDVIMLISYIKQQVRDKFDIQLEEEIQYLGF